MRSSAPQTALIVVSASLVWYRFLGLDGSEFSGGWLTGPILNLHFSGALLVTLALPILFVYPRASAAMTLAAVLCCLPLHLYFLIPGFFHRLFPGEYSVTARSYFEFSSLDFWSVMALSGLTLVSLAAVRRANRSYSATSRTL